MPSNAERGYMRRPSGAPGVMSGYSQSEDTTRTDDAWVSLPEPLVFPPDSLSASPKPFVCSPASADTGNAQAAPPVAAQPEDVVAQPEDVVAQPEDFVTTGGKWGSSGTLGTAGGTVTWSIVGADWTDATGQNFFTGSTVALSSFLPADFLAQIQSDFDLWAAVANIAFQQVADGGGNMGTGTTAMIRICGGFIDGNSGPNILGRAFFPPNGGNANAVAANGDIVLDSGNTWDDTLLEAVVLHEIGHSLGLNHETNTIAVMNPTIANPPLTALQTDDINGIRAVYGAKNLGNPPPPAATTADMITRRGADGLYYIYDIGNSSVLAAYQLGQVGTEWTVAGLGGFFGNDTSDMLLRNSNTGAFYVYDVQNNNITNSASLGAVGLDWQVMGFGNFSSFGETDMMMRRSSDGALVVYDIRNNQIIGTNVMGTVGLEWQFSGVGNFSSRGTSDMLLRNSNTGGLEVYDIDSNQITGAAFIGTVGLDWQFSGVGNFSSVPGQTDLLLRNNKTGGLEVYNINNNQLTGAAFIGTVGLDWQFAGVGPIHAAGASDLVLRNANTGAFQVYDIAFNSLIGSASLGSVGLDWQVGGIAVDPPTASSGSMDGSRQAAQLVQAMAGFGGGGGAADSLSSAPLGADTSQQALLTTPQHA